MRGAQCLLVPRDKFSDRIAQGSSLSTVCKCYRTWDRGQNWSFREEEKHRVPQMPLGSFPCGSFINNWPEHSQCDTFPGLETILATVELKEEQKY